MADDVLRSFWPKITDEASAVSAARVGLAGAGIVVVVTLAFMVWGLIDGKPIAGIGLSALIDVVLFLLIGFGIYRMSRVAAVAGLSLYLAELWFALKTNSGNANGFLVIIIVLAFISAIRGTIAYHRYKKLASANAESGV